MVRRILYDVIDNMWNLKKLVSWEYRVEWGAPEAWEGRGDGEWGEIVPQLDGRHHF